MALQKAHLSRALERRGLTDVDLDGYLDPSLNYAENLAGIEALTGLRLHDWTPAEIRAGRDSVRDYYAPRGPDVPTRPSLSMTREWTRGLDNFRRR